MAWITPFHQDSDFRWPLCLDDKVLIFEERISGWQLEIADACINGGQPAMRHSGWPPPPSPLWATWPCLTADRWRSSARRAARAA